MHRGRFTTRLRLGVASLAALVALTSLAVFAGAASAGGNNLAGWDPQNTNIPYLAWRGEQVRLVKCLDLPSTERGDWVGRFMIEDWSGDPFQRPQIVDNDEYVHWFWGTGEQRGRQCFATDLVSLKAGIALVKLKIFEDTAGSRTLVEHQFQVAWMQIGTVDVEDIGPTTMPAMPNPTVANQVQVRVTGTIPLGNNFQELGLGAQLVMPNDWERWARSNLGARHGIGAAFGRDPMLWDIHDELSWEGPGPDVHQNGGLCTSNPGSTTLDWVDNCTGGGELGPFSRFVHQFAGTPAACFGPAPCDMSTAAVGPFDPLRPATTYLPNGLLNAGDAPMPALQVDFNLTGTAGSLRPIDKHVVYSRNGNGSSAAHNLYAPFYGRYIPATEAQDANMGNIGQRINPEPPPTYLSQNVTLGTASGTSGGTGNNFQGYLVRGLYHYWDFAAFVSRNAQNVTNCPPFDPSTRAPQTASGPTFAAVYTDEHGEARVGFAPGTGFNWPALVTQDANGACDLQAQNVSVLGQSTISAIGRYPFQPVTAPDVAGDETVTKTVTSLFSKGITCVPKFPGATTTNFAFICTVTARGITGAPFVGERVCFTGNYENAWPFGTTATTPDPRTTQNPRLCVVLGANGTAQIEVIGNDAFKIIAEFYEERIFRVISINALPSTGAPGSGGVVPITQPVTSTQAPTQAEIISLGGVNVPKGGSTPSTQTPTKAKSPQVVSARLKATKKGRSLVVRVNGPAKQAKIRIVLRNKKGKTVATAVRTVRTNKAVAVPNLRIAKSVATVRITAIS